MQHRMREHGAKLASMILDDVATLYICGDGASMARDVEATIKQLFQVQTITTHPPTHSLTPATPTNSVSTLPLFAPPPPCLLVQPSEIHLSPHTFTCAAFTISQHFVRIECRSIGDCHRRMRMQYSRTWLFVARSCRTCGRRQEVCNQPWVALPPSQ